MKTKLTAILLLLSLYGYSQKKDTIPVMLLVTDSSCINCKAYSIRGYEVREYTGAKVWMNDFQHVPETKHVCYLKQNKKRPVKLIIWQSIEI